MAATHDDLDDWVTVAGRQRDEVLTDGPLVFQGAPRAPDATFRARLQQLAAAGHVAVMQGIALGMKSHQVTTFGPEIAIVPPSGSRRAGWLVRFPGLAELGPDALRRMQAVLTGTPQSRMAWVVDALQRADKARLPKEQQPMVGAAAVARKAARVLSGGALEVEATLDYVGVFT